MSNPNGLLSVWGSDCGEEGVGAARLITDIATHGALHSASTAELQPIIMNVTLFLNIASKRSKGFLILKNLLQAKAITDDILIDRGKVWMPICVHALKPSNVSLKEKALIIHIIKDLLEVSSRIHELERNVVFTVLSDLIDNLIKCQPEIHGLVLSCLEVLLSRYSKAVGPYKPRLDIFLVQFLDSDNKKIVISAAKCAHLLQQVRGGGEHGINHKLAWSHQFQLCVKASHVIVRELLSISDETGYREILFSNDKDVENNDTQIQSSKRHVSAFEMAFDDVCTVNQLYNLVSKDKDIFESGIKENQHNDSIIVRVNRLVNRLENILIFIQALLVEPYPVAKRMKCISLLDMLLQCLLLKTKVVNQETTLDKLAVILKVPLLRSAILRTLEALIICVRDDIIPYLHLLLKIITKILDESRIENNTGGIKPYKNVRISAYNTLNCLLSSLKTLKPPPHEGDKSFENHLLQNFLEDISPYKSSMQLTVTKIGSLKHMSKKSRKKLNMSQLEASGLGQNSSGTNSNINQSTMSENDDLTKVALACVESFFKSSGIFLKESTTKAIQTTLIKQIYCTTTSSLIKESLCKALMTVQTFQSKQQSSILPYCVDILMRHQMDDNTKIAFGSHSALTNCMNGIRGFIPPICFPYNPLTNTNEVISSEDEEENDNAPNENTGDVIDVDDCSNLDRVKSPELCVNGTKRKNRNDDEQNESTKIIQNGDSITIRDSDSEGEYITQRLKEKRRKTIKGPVFGDTINLIVGLSDDENNDVVCADRDNSSNKFNLNANESVKESMSTFMQETENVFSDGYLKKENNTVNEVVEENNIADVAIEMPTVDENQSVHVFDDICKKNIVEVKSDHTEDEIMKDHSDCIQDMLASFVDEVNDEFK